MVTGWRPAGSPDHGQRLEPAGDRLAVAHPRVRGHDDAGAGHLAAPREVEVLPHGHDPGVEALELGEEVGPDEDAAARGHEDVAHGVVLAVVDLALDDAVHHGARLVAAHPDVEEDARVVPVTNFGDTTPALERNDSSTSLCTASGSSATSSWQSRKKAAPSTMPRASLEAAA